MFEVRREVHVDTRSKRSLFKVFEVGNTGVHIIHNVIESFWFDDNIVKRATAQGIKLTKNYDSVAFFVHNVELRKTDNSYVCQPKSFYKLNNRTSLDILKWLAKEVRNYAKSHKWSASNNETIQINYKDFTVSDLYNLYKKLNNFIKEGE